MVSIIKLMEEHGHKELKAFRDEEAGLKGFIAIHDTTLGPAAGGTRRYVYNSEDEAIIDALRLSRAMTYKYAISGINLGGGKAVIMVDSQDQCSEELYRAYGRIVDSFNGRFITGADVGTGEREMRWINMETDYLVGLPEQFEHPGYFHGGGYGVVKAMEACCDTVYEGKKLLDLHIAVQGVGEMGSSVVHYLSERGAEITICDPDAEKIQRMKDRYSVNSVDPEAIYDVDCDIFAPCALGGSLNDDTIPRLTCDIVCGGANNQLEDEEKNGTMLHEKGILYSPDYLSNSGRTIDDTDLLRKGGYNFDRVKSMIDAIYDRAIEIFRRSEEEDRPTILVANDVAERRIEKIRKLRPKVYETRKPGGRRWIRE